ncbi:MAG: hypothetical protein ABI647_07720 [Gemmatimonadota bacterium]
MTPCGRLSDRMVAVVHGGDPWTAEEQAHLVGCGDCAKEWKVVVIAAGLGKSISLDGSALAARVTERLKTEPPRARSRILRIAAQWGVGLAAAAALILVVRPGPPRPDREQPRAVEVLHELDDLNADELEEVLRSVEIEGTAGATADPAIGDLTPSELERLLHSLEG